MSGPDIVERLGWHHEHPVTGKMVLCNPDGPEAAATITALQAEVERLQSENAYLRGKVEGYVIARAALVRTPKP